LDQAQHQAAFDIWASMPYRLLYSALAYSPTVGPNQFLARSFLDAVTSGVPGAVADIPIMVGTLRDEAFGLIYHVMHNNISNFEYQLALTAIFGLGNALKIDAQYPKPNPLPTDYDYRDRMSTVSSAGVFQCAVRNATMRLVAAPGRTNPVYLYHFQHASSFGEAEFGVGMEPCWSAKVCHSAELPFLFQGDTDWSWTAEEVSLGQQFKDYWTAFAINGKPADGGGAGPQWPAMTPGAAGVSSMLLDVASNGGNTVAGPTFDQDACTFWDNLGYAWY
jgi:carboxylesterase type B